MHGFCIRAWEQSQKFELYTWLHTEWWHGVAIYMNIDRTPCHSIYIVWFRTNSWGAIYFWFTKTFLSKNAEETFGVYLWGVMLSWDIGRSQIEKHDSLRVARRPRCSNAWSWFGFQCHKQVRDSWCAPDGSKISPITHRPRAKLHKMVADRVPYCWDLPTNQSHETRRTHAKTKFIAKGACRTL
jgi:hypothetical protein